MHNNYILKQAVLTALTMLSLGIQNSSFALGLGEIEVRSHIGQPLLANIKVHGVEGLKDQACFRLGNDSNGVNQINNANVRLGNIKGDEAVLNISTTEAINEPIVSLSVIAECDSTFRRDYVLLIDPLLTTEIESVSVEQPTNTVEITDNVVEKSVATTSRAIKTNSNQTVKLKKNVSKTRAVNKNSQQINDNIVLTTNYDKKLGSNSNIQSATSVNAKNISKESKPRLSISGGTFDSNANKIGLRLDKQLHFSAEALPQTVDSSIAIQDEATVLSNRLVHLEQQITTLQQRNRTLEAEKIAQIKPQSKNLVESTIFNSNTIWWPYLAGAGLIIGSYFAANFWRRRRQSQQLNSAEDVWNVLDANSNNVVYYKDIDLEDTLFEDKPAPDAKSSDELALTSAKVDMSKMAAEAPFQIEEDNFEHNILDHADVFLSHGRTSLAIQLLQNHLLDFPKQSVTIWLFLLDLVAKENLPAVYEQTALECKEHFNIKIADFASESEPNTSKNLESFSRLTNGLQQVWGTPAALVYLDDLIYNSRLEARVGFEKGVIEELVLLRSIAQNNFNTADVIHLDEKKMAIKELKEAKMAATKAEKLQKLEELTLADTANVEPDIKAQTHEQLFEFNLIEYK